MHLKAKSPLLIAPVMALVVIACSCNRDRRIDFDQLVVVGPSPISEFNCSKQGIWSLEMALRPKDASCFIRNWASRLEGHTVLLYAHSSKNPPSIQTANFSFVMINGEFEFVYEDNNKQRHPLQKERF